MQQFPQIGAERRRRTAFLDAGEKTIDGLRIPFLAFPQEPEALPGQSRLGILFQHRPISRFAGVALPLFRPR